MPSDVVVISEYTGGGFGSKITSSISAIIPALLSKKTGAPVMMRISREEEHYIGRARPSMHGRLKVGFAKEGRITGDRHVRHLDNGPYDPQGDANQSGRIVSLMYQPPAMRWRGISVLTNTPPRVSQSQPGGFQGIALMEPIISKASRKLGIDQVAIHRINAPEGKADIGPPVADGKRLYVTSAFIKEALDKGHEAVQLGRAKSPAQAERHQSPRHRRGDQLLRRRLGRIRRAVRHQAGWQAVHPVRNRQSRHRVGQRLPSRYRGDPRRAVGQMRNHLGQHREESAVDLPIRRQPDHSRHDPRGLRHGAWTPKTSCSRSRPRISAANQKITKSADERVFRKGGGAGMTLAQAAQRAIELGGIYDGHELPKDINKLTAASAKALAGQGLLAVARDTMPRDGQTHSYVAGFAEVEVDLETGKYRIFDFLAVADVGTVIHPRALGGQVLGRSMLGIGHAIGQKWVYDQHYGLPLAKRFHHNKPPTILDAPVNMEWDALNIPDPETPVGARGIGEPPVGAGCMAILNALSDALGDEVFRRAPVTARHDSGFARSGQAGWKRASRPTFRQEIGERIWLSFAISCRPSNSFSRRPPTTRWRCSTNMVQDAWVMAGGLDSFDWLKDRIKRPKVVVDLSQIKELRGVDAVDGGIEIGAHDHADRSGAQSDREGEIQHSLEGAEAAASPQIRNQGTIGGNVSQDARCWYYRSGWKCYRAGGNICFADTPDRHQSRTRHFGRGSLRGRQSFGHARPALIALDAKMVIRSSKGERVVDAEDYFIGPGIDITRMTVLKPGDLLTAIRIPATWAGTQFYFEKIRDRPVWDFPLVNVASATVFTGGNIERIRIAVNGVAAHPVRLKASRRRRHGQAAQRSDRRDGRENGHRRAPSRCATTATKFRSCETW